MATPKIDEALRIQSRRPERHEEGHRLHQQWKDSGHSPEHFGPLLKHYEPEMTSVLAKYKGPNTPEPAARAHVAQLFHTAAQRWDPSAGANLGTYMTSYGKGLFRYNAQSNDLVRKTEDMAAAVGPVRDFIQSHKDEHGEVPKPGQIAAGLGQPLKTVRRVLRELGRREAPGSLFEGHEEAGLPDRYDEIKHLIPHMAKSPFTEQEKQVLYHMEGLNGFEATRSPGEIARKMGVSGSVVSKRLATLKEKMDRLMRGEG